MHPIQVKVYKWVINYASIFFAGSIGYMIYVSYRCRREVKSWVYATQWVIVGLECGYILCSIPHIYQIINSNSKDNSDLIRLKRELKRSIISNNLAGVNIQLYSCTQNFGVDYFSWIDVFVFLRYGSYRLDTYDKYMRLKRKDSKCNICDTMFKMKDYINLCLDENCYSPFHTSCYIKRVNNGDRRCFNCQKSQKESMIKYLKKVESKQGLFTIEDILFSDGLDSAVKNLYHRTRNETKNDRMIPRYILGKI